MHELFGQFVEIDLAMALQVVTLGFIGGILSGFIGSGGAFFMTPGMMNLGVDGVISVASNITHKFGKAMVGSRKHAAAGNVDKKLAAFMLGTALIGIQIAVEINSYLFHGGGGGHGAGESAGANLYISLVFASILSVVAVCMLRDAFKSRSDGNCGPSTRITDLLSRLHLPPVIHFRVADAKVSVWVLMIVGIATGYLAGTIGVGGFIGVPAMIYVFGVPTAVATGTELYLAVFMGGYGALSYAFQGFVDFRLTALLYLGSLVGIHLGVYGVKVVAERYIRVVTGLIILLCVFSRVIAIPVYLRQLGYLYFDPAYDVYFNTASKFFLFGSGVSGAAVILQKVIRANRQRRRVQKTLLVVKEKGLSQQTESAPA
jgi:uncharacterized membrane protein YfcA